MSTIETFITNHINHLIHDKLIGTRFTTYQYFDGVSFCDNGTHQIDVVDSFRFVDKTDREFSGYNYDAQIPSYELRVSGTVLATGEKFSRCISIKDLP